MMPYAQSIMLHNLPSIYDKVRVDVAAERKVIKESWTLWLLALIWQQLICGLYGVFGAVIGGDYLLPRESFRKTEVKDAEITLLFP